MTKGKGCIREDEFFLGDIQKDEKWGTGVFCLSVACRAFQLCGWILHCKFLVSRRSSLGSAGPCWAVWKTRERAYFLDFMVQLKWPADSFKSLGDEVLSHWRAERGYVTLCMCAFVSGEQKGNGCLSLASAMPLFEQRHLTAWGKVLMQGTNPLLKYPTEKECGKSGVTHQSSVLLA